MAIARLIAGRGVEMKVCSTCKLPKSLDAYHKHPVKASGLDHRCKECARAYQRARYAAMSPAKTKERDARKQATKYGIANNTLTAQDIEWVLRFYGNQCAYCGRPGKLTIDHVTPLSRGGANSIENLVAACRSCNSRKWAKTPEIAGMMYRPHIRMPHKLEQLSLPLAA